MIIAPHRIQVASSGGCGTTLIYNFLRRIKEDIPKEPDAGIWKHMCYPPATPENPDFQLRKDYKAVYVFGNPLNSVNSLFKRKHHVHHLKRMGFDTILNVRMTLQNYLDNNKEDIFHLQEHFNNWITCPKKGRDYPILLLKYETLFDHLPELLDFLEIPQEKLPLFPKKRQRLSIFQSLPKEMQEQLHEIYGNLAKEVEKHPEFKII